MEYIIVFDFYSQTEQGLKNDIKLSGVENIDVWEDLKEDLNSIECYFFSSFDLKIVKKNILKVKTKYLVRIIVESQKNCELFYKSNRMELINKVYNGWSPFSLGGCKIKFVQISSDLISNALIFPDQIKNFKSILSKVKSIS